MTSLRGGAVEGGQEGGVVATVTRYDVMMQQWMLTQQLSCSISLLESYHEAFIFR